MWLWAGEKQRKGWGRRKGSSEKGMERGRKQEREGGITKRRGVGRRLCRSTGGCTGAPSVQRGGDVVGRGGRCGSLWESEALEIMLATLSASRSLQVPIMCSTGSETPQSWLIPTDHWGQWGSHPNRQEGGWDKCGQPLLAEGQIIMP